MLGPVMPSPPRRDRILLVLLSAGLALAVFGPALPHLDERLLGRDFVDLKGTAWFYWLVDQALGRGEGLARTDLVFFPWGKDLFGHTGSNFLDALVALPFRRLLGEFLGFNAFLLLGLLATGLALERVLRMVSEDRLATGLGATLAVLGPWVLYDVAEGRPTQAVLLLPVLALGALWRTGSRPGLGAPMVAGLALALCGYQYWFYGLFAGLAALGHGLACLAVPPVGSGGRLRVLGRHALAAAVAVVLVLPAAWPLVAGSASGDLPGLVDPATWTTAAQPMRTPTGEEIAPLAWHPLVGVSGFIGEGPGGEVLRKAMHPVPLVAWPFALAGLVLARGRRLRLLGLLLGPALVALGPTLIVGDLAVLNPAYKALALALPFLRRLWWPARAMAVLLVPGTMCAVIGLAALRRRWPLPGAGIAVVITLLHAAHLGRDHLLAIPAWDPAVPAAYHCLAQGPEGAIIELPWGGLQDHLVWQSAHGRPLFGGPAERNPELVPAETRQLIARNPWLNALVRLSSGPEVLGEDVRVDPGKRRAWTRQDREHVQELGFRYVVVRRDELHPEPGRDRRLRRLLGAPVYEDARVWIHAPWGGGSPCAEVPVQPDTQRLDEKIEPWRAALGSPGAAMPLRRP